MKIQTTPQLATSKCVPCEGGVPACTLAHSKAQLAALNNWQLSEDGLVISRNWKMKNFVQAMELLNACAAVAEEQQHHPDLHLTGYRLVRVELTTHAIGGLSENDFILAAKINAVSEAIGL